MLQAIILRAKNPNWQESWPESNIHKRDRQAEDLNSGPPSSARVSALNQLKEEYRYPSLTVNPRAPGAPAGPVSPVGP